MGGTVIKEFECRLIQKDGRLIFISVSSQPVITESGEHVGNRLSIRDITERKTAEEALRHSEEKFKKVVSTSPDAIMVFDAKTKKIVEVNKACEDLYGYVRKEFLDLCQPDISAEPEKSATSIIRALKGKLHHIPLRYHRKNNGTVFPVEISMATFDYFGYTMICEVVRDISERKRLEREIIEISGREQRRIGQDLHDGLGQQLTGVSYMLMALVETLRQKGLPEVESVARAVELIDETISQAHTLSQGLCPVEIEENGLAEALRGLWQQTNSTYDIRCLFD
jgi:PAS domain S-box-containing protein